MKLKDIVPYCLDYTQKSCLKYYWIIDGLTYTIDSLQAYSPANFLEHNYDPYHKIDFTRYDSFINLIRYNFVNPHEKGNQYDDRKNYLTLNLNNEITIHNNFIMVHKTEDETTDSERDTFCKTHYYLVLLHTTTNCMMFNLRTTIFKDLVDPPVQSKPVQLTLDEKVDNLIDELEKDARTMAIKKLKRMLNERL